MKGKMRFFLSNISQCIIAAVFIVFLLFSIYSYINYNSDRIDKQYDEQLTETGNQLADAVNRRMQDSVMLVEALAEEYRNVEDIHSTESIEKLIRINKKTNFTRMWLTKEDGTAISSSKTYSNAAGRDYLIDALKGNSGISNAQSSRVNGEKNVVIYAPIYYGNNVSGILIGIYALDQLSDIMKIKCFNNKGYTQIFDGDGQILFESFNQFNGKEKDIYTLCETVSFDHNKTVEDVKNDLANNQSSIIQFTYNGQKHDCYYTPIGINNWFLFISQPYKLLTQTKRNNIMAGVSLCIKFIIVVAIVLAYRYYIKSEMLKRLAGIDWLTGLYNRGMAEKKIKQILEKNEKQSALILFDIDKFKILNDTMGHISGDDLLKQIAKKMEKHFSQCDILSRFGGDEFVIFIPEVIDKKKIYEGFREFSSSVHSLQGYYNNKVQFSISAGIAFSKEDGDDFYELYQKVDERMYDVKRKGGNDIFY